MAIRRFRGGAMAARCARRAVREELSDALPQRRLADVELLVSELATNSVRHAGCGEEDELSLEAAVEPDRVRVRMFDAGRGYGLVLLDHLSDRWGVQPGERFSVWFEVHRDRLPFGDERSPRAQTA